MAGTTCETYPLVVDGIYMEKQDAVSIKVMVCAWFCVDRRLSCPIVSQDIEYPGVVIWDGLGLCGAG